jgi:hypothetical protein
MRGQIDRAEVADGGFIFRSVEGDLGVQVGAMYDADMLLRRAQIARVFEGDPRMPGFKQHGEHLAPQLHGRDFAEQADFAASGLGGVGVGKGAYRAFALAALIDLNAND